MIYRECRPFELFLKFMTEMATARLSMAKMLIYTAVRSVLAIKENTLDTMIKKAANKMSSRTVFISLFFEPKGANVFKFN